MSSVATEKISLFQLFILIYLFQIGSAVVVGIGTEAKQDAWIAILIATVIGIAIIKMYTYILNFKTGKSFFEIIELTVGKSLAITMTFLYSLYFFYIAARVLRDFLELLITDIYPHTPIEVLAVIFMFLVLYVSYLGIEVLARTSETFIPYVFLLLILLTIFLLIGGNFQVSNLQPVLAEGFKPVLNAVFPSLIGFPFGEAIVLTVVMTLSNNFEKVTKVSIGAIIFSGVTLTIFKIIQLMALGVATADRAAFPLLSAAREISFAEFIERVDAAVIFIMMLGIFIKVSLFFYGGLRGLEYVSKIPYRYYTIPMSMTVAIFSILISSNFAEHIEEGINFVPLYLHMPMQIGFPLLIVVIISIKKQRKGGLMNV